jgi:DUF4097 and DUF4098 domain-containing protein YvlB
MYENLAKEIIMYEFPCPEPVALSMRIAGGAAEIVAEDRAVATVEVSPYDGSEAAHNAAARTRVELADGVLVVEAPEWTGLLFRRGPRVRVTVRLPRDGDLSVTVASADVRAAGRYRAANLNSASGDISVEHITGDASAKSASGDVRLGRVDGDLRINGASGDFFVEQVGGDVSAHSASGDIAVDRVGGSFRATTASGDIQVGATTTGTVQVKSASGDVRVGVVPGTAVWLDLTSMSGDTRTDLEMPQQGGDQSVATLTLQVRTASGDIDVYRAHERANA